MYKIWLIFKPRLLMAGIFATLIFVAVVIHTLLLSTERYNWIEGISGGSADAAVQQSAAPPGKQPQ